MRYKTVRVQSSIDMHVDPATFQFGVSGPIKRVCQRRRRKDRGETQQRRPGDDGS